MGSGVGAVDAAAGHAVLGLPRLGPLRAGDEGRRVGDPPQGGRGDAQRPHGAQRRRGNASPCHQGGDAVPEDVVVVRIVSVCVHLVHSKRRKLNLYRNRLIPIQI